MTSLEDRVRRPALLSAIGTANISTSITTATTASNAIPLDAWTHLASTFDGSVLRLYVNGSLAASQNVSGSIVTAIDNYFSNQLARLPM